MEKVELPRRSLSERGSYNTVFEKLVDEAEDELVGLVAYGLYKKSKREWVLDFTKENGRRPTDAEYKSHSGSQTQTTLDSYQSRAAQTVTAYANDFLETKRPAILKDAIKGTFWRSFWPSYWASFAFAVTLVLIAIILAWQGAPLPVQFGRDNPPVVQGGVSG